MTPLPKVIGKHAIDKYEYNIPCKRHSKYPLRSIAVNVKHIIVFQS